MKKTILLFLCITVILSFCSCSAKNKTSNTNQEGQSNSSVSSASDIDTKSEDDSIDDNEVAAILEDDSHIEKIIISYFRESSDFPYDSSVKELIESITNCKETPKAELTDKIGKIEIQYNNEEDLTVLAYLYLGADMNIYAKYNSKDNESSNCALKLDENLFSKFENEEDTDD